LKDLFDFQAVILISVIVSFFSGVIDKFTPQSIKGSWILLVICLLVTYLITGFVFDRVFIAYFLFHISFAFLFYEFGGKWVINKFFSLIKNEAKQ